MISTTKKSSIVVPTELDQQGKIIAEYIWIDGTGINMRSKARSLDCAVTSIDQIPVWNYDGSSCYQAETDFSEVILQPVAMFKCPFRRGDNILVLCETMVWKNKEFKELVPANTNFRHASKKIFDKAIDQKFWFGIEQEYSLLVTQNNFTTHPLGFPASGFPGPQGPYYCSIGPNYCFGREIMDTHFRCCQYAGIKIAGTNGEVMPGQWEYQIGPSEGIDIGDHMWISRYLLGRVAEEHEINFTFKPKLFQDWNGAGCHTNFSDQTMRDGTKGMQHIDDFCEKLASKHKGHIELYGQNEQRLTGHHETSSVDTFSSGIGNRAASVRIPTSVAGNNGKGYIEDRRPASDIDPYVVAAMIIDTTTNAESMSQELIDHYRLWKRDIDSKKIPLL